MRLCRISHLITHPRGQNKFAPIGELGVQFTFDAKQDVTFTAPVISCVTRAIFNHADTDLAKLLCAPVRHPRVALMFSYSNL